MKQREIVAKGRSVGAVAEEVGGRREEVGGIKMWRSSEYNYLSPEKIPVQSAKAHVSICECIFIGLPVKVGRIRKAGWEIFVEGRRRDRTVIRRPHKLPLVAG